MQVKEIQSRETLDLRLKILRPNGSLKDCEFPGDSDASTRHYGAFQANRIVGIASVYKHNHEQLAGIGFQIRSMATLPEVRKTGVGHELLKRAESYARASGADYIWANARVSAINFYRKFKYDIGEKEFIIKNIGPHVLISKLAT